MTLKQYFEPDFVCFDKVIVEIKATSQVAREHKAQTINYLHATRFELALLVNFGHYPLLEYERFGNLDGYRSIDEEIKTWVEQE